MGGDAPSNTLAYKYGVVLQNIIGFECNGFLVSLQNISESGFATQILAVLNLDKITRGAAIIAPLCPRLLNRQHSQL